MMTLDLRRAPGHPLRLLCLGAHSDDLEIGCGGTVLRLLAEHPGTEVTWVVLSAAGARETEARTSAERLLTGAGAQEIVLRDFRDGFLPYVGGAVKEFCEELKRRVSPDLVLTHTQHDLHQDHRLVWELTWNTFRDHLILEYEVVKYDGDLGQPNLFVPLAEATARAKVRHLLDCFGTQRSKDWFTEDTFLALMRLRGVECRAQERFAEAFHVRKVVL
jgi:LmbE family N-acetylglucosaminyl deacetylase